MEEAIGPVLPEVTGEQAMGRIAFSAVAVVVDLELLNPLGLHRLVTAWALVRQLPITLHKEVKGCGK